MLILVISAAAGCGKKSAETVTDTNTGTAAETKEEAVEDTAAEEPAADSENTATSDSQETSQTSSLPTGHKADTVKIGFVDVTGTGIISDTLGVARDQGFIEEELGAIGVKAEFIPMTGAGPAINEALAGGSLDVGFLGDFPAIIGKAAGIDTQLISFSGLNSGSRRQYFIESGGKRIRKSISGL